MVLIEEWFVIKDFPSYISRTLKHRDTTDHDQHNNVDLIYITFNKIIFMSESVH